MFYIRRKYVSYLLDLYSMFLKLYKKVIIHKKSIVNMIFFNSFKLCAMLLKIYNITYTFVNNKNIYNRKLQLGSVE